jgi:HK97 gp10 family phage protein
MVLGLASFNRKMNVAIPAKVREATRKAMEQGANEMVAFAKALCPVDQGDLRDSIGWTWGDAPKGSISLGGVARRKDGDEVITIYAGDDRAFYARWQEFGTQKHSASPFFYPAYRTLKKRIKSRVTRNMKKAIKEAVR